MSRFSFDEERQVLNLSPELVSIHSMGMPVLILQGEEFQDFLEKTLQIIPTVREQSWWIADRLRRALIFQVSSKHVEQILISEATENSAGWEVPLLPLVRRILSLGEEARCTFYLPCPAEGSGEHARLFYGQVNAALKALDKT